MSTFRQKLHQILARADDNAADFIEKAGVKVYGTLGGQVAARDEQQAVDAGRAHNWEEAIKGSLKVDADIARHLTGRDKGAQR